MLKKIGSAVAFLLVLGGLTVANVFYTPPEVSQSERRLLKTMPELSVKTIVSGSFMSEFEDYAMDSFVVRDTFRAIKANMLYKVYRQKDNHGIYFVDGHGAKLETLDEQAVAQTADKISDIAALIGEGSNLYYAVVPDKGYYLAAENGYPAVDYEKLEQILAEELTDFTSIDLKTALSQEDYYKTDLHWKQAQLAAVIDCLEAAMDFQTGDAYTSETLSGFRGVYAGQSALNLPAETVTLLHNDVMDQAIVSYLNTSTGEMEEGALYNLADFEHVDPYDVFLGGPQALITLENPNAESRRELILFRDSFSSSLAPLLIEGYAKITLVDLRYISARILPEYLTVEEGTDILFLYGLQILNQPTVLMT